MGKRYDIRHSKDDPGAPFTIGLPHILDAKYDRVDIYDKETRTSATGWGNSREEAEENAWKELDEKRGI